jgi:hypothetical protein
MLTKADCDLTLNGIEGVVVGPVKLNGLLGKLALRVVLDI